MPTMSKKLYKVLSAKTTQTLEGRWTDNPATNDRMWQEEALRRLTLLKQINPQVGRLLSELDPAGYDQRLQGIGHFMWSMTETGNFHASLRGACEAAGLEAPPEDRGPFDKLVDRSRASRSSGTGLRKLWHDLNQPRRH